MKIMNNKGIALIAIIVLIIFVGFAVAGVTTFIAQRLIQFDIQQRDMRCRYNAQAGIHYALYNFRFHAISANGYFSKGQTNIDPNNYFVIGATAADLLMVNTRNTVLQSSSRNVAVWPIQNATNSNTITIATMTVSWSGVSSNRRLQQIWLGNGPTQVWPAGGGSGSATSGTNLNINDFTLDATPTLYSANFLRFNNTMTGGTVTVQFFMTDGTSKTLTLYPFFANNNFTVKASGKTTGRSSYRTLAATYNALTAKVIDYDEISTSFP